MKVKKKKQDKKKWKGQSALTDEKNLRRERLGKPRFSIEGNRDKAAAHTQKVVG
jgi:hypothetical protein